MFMQIAETISVHCLCKLLRRSGAHVFMQIAETMAWSRAAHPYRSLLGPGVLKRVPATNPLALLIAQLAALLRWDVSDETLCLQVLQVPAQSLFRYPDVFGNVCYFCRVAARYASSTHRPAAE